MVVLFWLVTAIVQFLGVSHAREACLDQASCHDVSAEVAQASVMLQANSKSQFIFDTDEDDEDEEPTPKPRCQVPSMIETHLEEARDCLPADLPEKRRVARQAELLSSLLTSVPTNGNQTAKLVGNWYRKDSANVGSWGGICTCPDGANYEVGDDINACASIACKGGVAGPCSDGGISEANWGMKVTCSPAATTTTTKTTTATMTISTTRTVALTEARTPASTAAFIAGPLASLTTESTDAISFASFLVEGANATLDAPGFKGVTSLCCPPEMDIFFGRLLSSMGLVGCSKPHIQGLMHWFTCVPEMDFRYLIDVIKNGNPCKYWGLEGVACPELSEKCQGSWCR